MRIALAFMRALADPAGDPLALLESLSPSIHELLAAPSGRTRLQLIVRYTLLRRTEMKVREVARAFRRAVGPEAAEVAMSTEQKLIEKGRKKGRKQGLAKGARKASRQILEHLLLEKFGPLSKATRSRLDAATADEMCAWATRVLAASRIGDVFSRK